MDKTIYSVTRLTRDIKEVLENSFPRLWMEGEISNFTHHSSGHMYLTLKDANCQIKCAMWRSRVGKLNFRPQNGMQVLVEGDIQVYERNGNYQLILQQMQPAGAGSLQLAFEELKKRLHAEGLFDALHKKELPPYPSRIGIVTSPTGAAIRDMLNVLERRAPGVDIVIAPARVQGPGAAEEIAAAITDFNTHSKTDLLIVGRGGGSLEDLWAFNEEIVARAIFNSELPIISAVGHEVDYSIADFVADLRAPTPSAAAELAVRDQREIRGQLAYYRERMTNQLKRSVNERWHMVNNLRNSHALRRITDILYQRIQHLDELERQLSFSMRYKLQFYQRETLNLQKRLEAANPEAILSRGYSIVTKKKKPLLTTKSLKTADEIHVKLAKGEFTAEVKTIGENNE
ncbi:MAG: exodeoxyribonuclease VII large subunit [Calditrichota bacterium]